MKSKINNLDKGKSTIKLKSDSKEEVKKKKRRVISFERKNAIAGMLFILPWFLGFIFFFLKPSLQSLLFTFQKIFVGEKGFTTEFVGLDNYRYIFMVDPDFIRRLVESVRQLVFEVPLILVFSVFIGVILNQKFKGRVLARSLFFIPVIIASGIVIDFLKQDVLAQSISESATVYLFQSTSVKDILIQSGMNISIANYLVDVISHIFDLTWKSGIQILLVLASLQTIPTAMYEASSMEGATAWESFWKITFPMISPIILLNVIYSIVDSFVDYRNVTMRKILTAAETFKYELSSAMAWSYFIIIGFILFAVFRYASKKVFYAVD